MKSMKSFFVLVFYLSSITAFAQTQYNNFIKKDGAWIKTDIHVYGDSDFETDNVTLTSAKYKYILTFEKGILVNYKPSDGLGKWARYLQEGQYFSKMEKYAKNYWGTNQDKIIWELNTQSDAWSKIPSLFQNNYCYLFSENNGEVCNAKIMNITLYGDTSITENEFKDITHNKAKFDGILTYYGKRCRRYSYMDYYFLFEEDGTFYKVVEK